MEVSNVMFGMICDMRRKNFLCAVVIMLMPVWVCAEAPANISSSKVTRGEYLVRAAACGMCHGASYKQPKSPLSGGREIRDSYGRVQVPNITSDIETGIGSWSRPELQTAIRSSIGKDGSYLSVDSHSAYRWMSDEDVSAISDYLLSTKPVKNELPRRKISSFTARKWGLFNQHEPVKGYVPGISQSGGGYYGMYLVNHVAGCQRCHSPSEQSIDSTKFMAGSQGRKFVPNVLYDYEGDYPEAPTLRHGEGGMIGWRVDDLLRFLSTGKGLTPDTDAKFCPTSYYSFLSEKDKRSIIKYLRSLQ